MHTVVDAELQARGRGFGSRVTAWSATIALLSSQVLAAPPRDRSRGGAGEITPSRMQRLVTGDVENLENAVAGTAGATLKFYFTPRTALPGSHPSLAYPAGATITGQVLTVSGGGFTSAWIAQIEGWDPDGDGAPLLRSFQDKIDAQGFKGANAAPANTGCDLVYPAQSSFPCQNRCAGGSNNNNPCVTNSNCPGGTCSDPCPTILGEPGPKCGATVAGVCDWNWQNTTRADWIFAGLPPADVFPFAPIFSPTGPIFGGATVAGQERHDSGNKYYTGTLALPVPTCSKGTYTIGHVAPETFAQDQQQPAQDIPVAAMVAGQLTIQTGSCCTNIGQQCGATCTPNQTLAECNALPSSNSHVFRPNADCSQTCDVGCHNNAACDDCDGCTTDRCISSACVRTPKSGWVAGSSCCDSQTGVVTFFSLSTSGGSPGCYTAECSLPDSHGSVVVTPEPAGTPCTPPGGPDPCLVSTACDGQTHCTGQANLGPECLKNRYVTFVPEEVGGASALRVMLDALQRPSPPNPFPFPPQNFSAFEGQIRWVGPVQDCPETEAPPTFFKCAYLQCTPTYADWTSLSAGQWLHLMGPEIMPSSAYTVEQLSASCQGNDANCTDIVMTTQLQTARHGDCRIPFQDPSPSAPLTQPDIFDVVAVVDKLKDLPTAISRTRAQLYPNSIAVGQHINIGDITAVIDAFKGFNYVQPGPQPCP